MPPNPELPICITFAPDRVPRCPVTTPFSTRTELLVGTSLGRRAVGQIAAYMGVLIQGKKPIRGILVAEEFSPQAIAAARVVRDLQLRKYSFKFAFGIVGAG